MPNWCDIFWVCLQLTLSSNFVIDCVFTVGASIMTQVPFWSFRRRVRSPSWSHSAILLSFFQLMSPGLEWPIGIRCLNLIQCPYSGKAGRCGLGFASSHVSNKVKGACELHEQGNNQNEAESKDGERTDRSHVLGPSHLRGCLLLQFIWAVHVFSTWFALIVSEISNQVFWLISNIYSFF